MMGREWATPCANERQGSPSKVDHGIRLANQAEESSRQAQETQPGGLSGPQRTVLNPEFVERLMGFRVGRTDSARWAMP